MTIQRPSAVDDDVIPACSADPGPVSNTPAV